MTVGNDAGPETGPDWPGLLASWDRQQQGYMTNREERFSVLLDVVEEMAGAAPVVLDLCCGPGSLSQRLLDRLPDARVVAIDADPVLQLLGQRGRTGAPITWLLHDLRRPGWEEAVAAHGPFDAVVSTTALHWLTAGELAAVYEVVARILRPGGVLVDGDHLFEPLGHPRLRRLQESLRLATDDGRVPYDRWWDELERQADADADLAEAFALRHRVGAGFHDPGPTPGLDVHRAVLVHAGFGEVGTVWQRGDDRLLVALRD